MALNSTRIHDLSGIFSVTAGDGNVFNMKIPGTLDENNIGHRDVRDYHGDPMRSVDSTEDSMEEFLDAEDFYGENEEEPEDRRILTRLTRKYTYEGPVRISRMISFREEPGKRLFLEIERARELRLFIDAEEVDYFRVPSLVTPHIFEVTHLLDGNHMLSVESDNSFQYFPRENILFSNMGSDDTQTNWNGLLGYVRLREEEETFVDRVIVRTAGKKLSAMVEIAGVPETECVLTFTSPALTDSYEYTVTLKKEFSAFMFSGMALIDSPVLWDEGEGNLYELTVSLNGVSKTVPFGIRTFSANKKGRLTLNGRTVFLRGETNCAVFPETSYAPLSEDAWEQVFRAYRSYGVNFVRFATNCPPEAAFTAADRMGMMLLVELSCARWEEAFNREEARNYYKIELAQILRFYGNHPSFVMMIFTGDDEFLSELREIVLKLDPTKVCIGGEALCGGEEEPDALKPKLLLNAGRHEMLPDFREIDLFSGVLEPDHLAVLREEMKAHGLSSVYAKAVSASGEAAWEKYKDDIERAYRDRTWSGICLSGLQDFPGGGIHPFGMMNSHLVPKAYPFANPKRFSSVFAELLPMAEMKEKNYTPGEMFAAMTYVANYGKEPVMDTLSYRLMRDKETVLSGALKERKCGKGTLSRIGQVKFALPEEAPADYRLVLSFGKKENSYSIHVYPSVIPICPQGIYETDRLDDTAVKFLELGGTVLLMPEVPEPSEENCRVWMDETHPLFYRFETEDHLSHRWDMAGAIAGLPLPRNLRAVMTSLPDIHTMAPYAVMAEFRCNGGHVFLCTLNLKKKLRDPGAAFLVSCIYDYVESYDFSPSQEVRLSELSAMLSPGER